VFIILLIANISLSSCCITVSPFLIATLTPTKIAFWCCLLLMEDWRNANIQDVNWNAEAPLPLLARDYWHDCRFWQVLGNCESGRALVATAETLPIQQLVALPICSVPLNFVQWVKQRIHAFKLEVLWLLGRSQFCRLSIRLDLLSKMQQRTVPGRVGKCLRVSWA
jgi:hypothetical protein